MIPLLPLKLILVHFLSDFVFQSRKMATEKSSHLSVLLMHMGIIFFCFLPLLHWEMSLVNAVVHGIIDWNIWKLYKASVKLRVEIDPWHELYDDSKTGNNSWRYYEDHWFYLTIGLDQTLHVGTLLVLLNFVN